MSFHNPPPIASAFSLSLGLLRETQTLIDLANLPLNEEADKLAAHLYKLLKAV